MKREVASSLVERGVAERVRLTQAYEKKRTDLQKQHDAVKAALSEHKNKVNSHLKYTTMHIFTPLSEIFFEINVYFVLIIVVSGKSFTRKRNRITHMHFIRQFFGSIQYK